MKDTHTHCCLHFQVLWVAEQVCQEHEFPDIAQPKKSLIPRDGPVNMSWVHVRDTKSWQVTCDLGGPPQKLRLHIRPHDSACFFQRVQLYSC